MKRIIFSLSFVFVCALGACSTESDVVCEVVWSDADDNELGSATLVYTPDEAVDSQAGVDLCTEDQMDDPARPADAMQHSCSCSTM